MMIEAVDKVSDSVLYCTNPRLNKLIWNYLKYRWQGKYFNTKIFNERVFHEVELPFTLANDTYPTAASGKTTLF